MMTRGRIRGLVSLAAACVVVAGIAGCTASPAVEPVVVDVDDLQGTTVEVPLSGTLIILTDWSDVDRYTAEIADPAVAEFVEGADTGDAAFSPRLTPLQVGETEVTLIAGEGGIREVEFTLEVTPAP